MVYFIYVCILKKYYNFINIMSVILFYNIYFKCFFDYSIYYAIGGTCIIDCLIIYRSISSNNKL